MIHQNNKQLKPFIILSFLMTFNFINTAQDELHDIDIINTNTLNKESKAKKKKTTSVKSAKKEVTIDPQTLPKEIDYSNRVKLHEEKRKIKNIHITGNVVITKASILNKLPLQVGDTFNMNYTATMIKNLYQLGYFHQVKIYAEPIGDKEVDLFIVVEEKPRFKEAIFIGNKALSSKELNEELKIPAISTLVKEELTALTSKIKKQYQRKNYHQTEVTSKIIPLEKGQVSAEFNIKEGKKSYLTRILFKGNKHVSSKKLKRIIYSKEDWILGMIDRSGTYNPEMIEGDKYAIEEGYKNNGFINAKVTDVAVEKDQDNNYIITYTIHEGDRYVIKSVDVPGNDTLSESQLKMVVPIYPGQYYSLENIRKALENLKMLWGEYGYLFADIEPIIDVNDEEKNVTLSFKSDLKEKVYLNRLTIKGNKKSKDSVIRRQILLEEGELISNPKMEASKARVGLLNYFDPKDGVTWKTTRIDDTHADLDLLVKEVKTGHFQCNLGYGGSPTNNKSPQTGLNFNCSTGDRNLLGTGIAASIMTEISKKYQACNVALMNPWLFDRPIRGSINAIIKKSEYEDFKIAQRSPIEQTVGANGSIGYIIPRYNGIFIEGSLGFERISYDCDITAAQRLSNKNQGIAQQIINKNFQEGSQITVFLNLAQDKRNGLVFTTQGHQWRWLIQLTTPASSLSCDPIEESCPSNNLSKNSRFQYFKTEFDGSWYTPLIGEHDLVLCVHGNAGFIHRFENKDVPWRGLYHVGGPTTVRGYTYGQVGPNWMDTSLGAKKAFNLNVELTTPLSSNLNTRAVVFYDGGAGWDTPYLNDFCKFDRNFGKELKNNNFFYRHSVGVGIRIKSPSPMQVDFGIKLNPSNRFKKNLTEMHLAVEHTF